MVSRLHFLPFPAPDGIVQRCALVVCKEVPDILVVFKLRPNFRRMLQRIVGFHGIPVGLSRIFMQPLLKLHLEVEALANMPLKESSQFLGAYYTLGNNFVQRGRNVFLSFKHRVLLRLRRRRNRCFDERRQVIPVIHIVDIEVVLGTVIRRHQDDFFQRSPARLRHLDEKVVITNEAEENAIAVGTVISHHLLHGYLTSVRALVYDVLYIVRI